MNTEKILKALEMARNWIYPPYDDQPAKPKAEFLDAAIAELREVKPTPGESLTIYVASKTKHALMWLAYRANGVPIISTWIDESMEGQTKSYPDLWTRCINESKSATAMIVYGEESDILNGALVELGSALGSGKTVYLVGDCPSFKTFVNHPHIRRSPSVADAIASIVDAWNTRANIDTPKSDTPAAKGGE